VSFLLDTNVVSEWAKPQPHAGVVTWLADADEDQLFLSVVTIGELRYGIDSMAPGKRRRDLENWLSADLLLRFEGRILDVGSAVALAWGTLMATARAAGRPLSALDGFLAATATIHELTLVTRDTEDFRATAVPLLNPWTNR
jgi:predicted nucleic acid-binding protein